MLGRKGDKLVLELDWAGASSVDPLERLLEPRAVITNTGLLVPKVLYHEDKNNQKMVTKGKSTKGSFSSLSLCWSSAGDTCGPHGVGIVQELLCLR